MSFLIDTDICSAHLKGSGIVTNRFLPMPLLIAIISLVLMLADPRAVSVADVVESVEIERVWSAHPVGFCLLTHGEDQFVAYYDAQRRMSVAQRKLGQRVWTIKKLPRTTGWDSHNSVTMAIDSAGYLHVSGDMHCVPLVYFRSSRPLDVKTLEPVHRMTGEREGRVTYPVFMRDGTGALIFRYRDGRSGSGDDIYNRYDPADGRWRRLIDRPVVSGEDKANAYCSVPRLGPDGLFHMVWVWRDTPDAATNHDPSYARSRDLVNWETSGGAPRKLPITQATGEVVDHVPVHGGVINGNVHVGFDSAKRPVVTYHKYDARGRTQIYAARREGDGWVMRQISDWDYRWDFGGGGAIGFDVTLGAVRSIAPGRLALSYRYPKGAGEWVLDEETLKVIPGEKVASRPGLPREITRLQSAFPGMVKRVAYDSAGETDEDSTYALVWETLGPNRDQPRQPPLPEPVMLRVVKIRNAPR